MPCKCDYLETSRQRGYDAFERDISILSSECNRLTQLLCYAVGVMKDNKIKINGLDQGFVDWVNRHQIYDMERSIASLEMAMTMTGVNEFTNKEKEYWRDWFITVSMNEHALSEYHKTKYFNEVWKELKKRKQGGKYKSYDIEQMKREDRERMKIQSR